MATVLVVDDDPHVMMLTCHIVTKMGHHVVEAVDGSSALHELQQRTFDLIITDFNLPGQPSGLDLIEALHQRHPGCPVVVSTGHTETDSVDELKKNPAFHVLPKPFEVVGLRQLITGLLNP